jgi:hypothetical protein
VSWLTFLTPFAAITGWSRRALLASLAALALLIVGALLHRLVVPHVRHRASTEYPWFRQMAVAAVVSGAGLWIWHMLPLA